LPPLGEPGDDHRHGNYSSAWARVFTRRALIMPRHQPPSRTLTHQQMTLVSPVFSGNVLLLDSASGPDVLSLDRQRSHQRTPPPRGSPLNSLIALKAVDSACSSAAAGHEKLFARPASHAVPYFTQATNRCLSAGGFPLAEWSSTEPTAPEHLYPCRSSCPSAAHHGGAFSDRSSGTPVVLLIV